MNFFRLLFGGKSKSRKARKSSKASPMSGPNARHPGVEALEDRCLLSGGSALSMLSSFYYSSNLSNANASSLLASCNTNTNQANHNTTSNQTNCTTTSNQTNCTTTSNQTNCTTTSNQTNCSTTSNQTSCTTTSNQTNCTTTSNQTNCTTTSNQTNCTTTSSQTSWNTNTNQSCGHTISGYVFYDANNNGLMDPGEPPLANVEIELLNNANNTIVGTTMTDANGYYQFTEDDSVGTAIQSITKTLTFPAGQTDYSVSGLVGQFDPSLGTLVSVSITNAGSITSDISVENTSSNSGSFISGEVGGNLTLTGPNGLSIQTNLAQYAGGFLATSFDGQLNFTGSSGDDFGPKTATGAQTTTLTGSDLAAFIGTGNVQLTETAVATSSASGGGNLVVGATSTASAQVNVVYNYIPTDCLKPGAYTIVKVTDPPGYSAGKESSHGVVLDNPPGSNVIPVTLTCANSCQNDFGELKASSLSGYVYADISANGYNDGIKEPDEAGIAGVIITLTGTTCQGTVNLTTMTDGNGFYQFGNLLPGTYTITETSPAGWVDGKDTVGTAGGIAGQDVLSNIRLCPGTNATNYNFGELQFSQIGGTVFYDGGVAGAFDNGVQDPGEPGIPGVTIQLGGFDLNGNPVSQSTVTDANGHYLFNSLAPGTYAVTDVQPTGFVAGKNTVGTAGGQQINGGFTNIFLAPGDVALNYNFAELLPSTISGYVYLDTSLSGYNDGIKEANEPGIAGVTITLTGSNDQGSVNQQAITDYNGLYSFTGLRPGTYTITETPPAGYIDGKDTLGAIKTGQVGQDMLSNIVLPPGTNDPCNNFGELSPSVQVYLVPPLIPGITPNPPTFATPSIPIVSKAQLLSSSINHPSTATMENAQFINSVYTSILGRTVDSASLASWLSYLQSGGSRQNIVTTVWDSAEHRAAEINAMYQAILGTAPNQATVNSFINMFNSGASELAVAAAIAGGSQGANLYPTTAAYVNELYTVSMGRTPAPSEQAAWASYAGNRTALALAIFTSQEALTDIVQQTYSQLLNRSAIATEASLWTPQLQFGASGFAAMIANLFTSAAYTAQMTV